MTFSRAEGLEAKWIRDGNGGVLPFFEETIYTTYATFIRRKAIKQLFLISLGMICFFRVLADFFEVLKQKFRNSDSWVFLKKVS